MRLSLTEQIVWLAVLALPISCVSWTVTHEEVFREPREYCVERSKSSRKLLPRKFFYLFTCEYCFSHYVTLAFLAATDFRLLFADWRGLVLAFFSLVAVANVYMSVYNRLRVEIRFEKVEIARKERAASPNGDGNGSDGDRYSPAGKKSDGDADGAGRRG